MYLEQSEEEWELDSSPGAELHGLAIVADYDITVLGVPVVPHL